MSQANKLIVRSDLHGFFRDEVQKSRKQLRVAMLDATEFYLVHLLVEFSHRGNEAPFGSDEPLLVLHQRAREAPAAKQLMIFKQLGDWALYVSGFFSEFIEKSLVTLEYYSAMGRAAYRNVAALTGSGGKPSSVHDTYAELSEKFGSAVDILTQICHRSRQHNSTDVDLLKLYDRYVRTQNDRVRLMLQGRGLHVAEMGSNKKESQH